MSAILPCKTLGVGCGRYAGGACGDGLPGGTFGRCGVCGGRVVGGSAGLGCKHFGGGCGLYAAGAAAGACAFWGSAVFACKHTGVGCGR